MRSLSIKAILLVTCPAVLVACSSLLLLLLLLLLLSPARAQSFYHEAPQVAALVAAGELPPAEQRLPQNPMLIKAVERIGEYGGTWRLGTIHEHDLGLFARTIGYENLVRWNPEWTQVIPNIAQSVEANDDATEYTFYLRKGMRWSDGTPYSADDILFWAEKIMPNPKLTRNVPYVPFIETVEKIDAYTVRFTLNSPNGQFLQQLSAPAGGEVTRYPAHYLSQFHPDNQPKQVETLVKELGMESWIDLFRKKSNWFDPELPVIFAWRWTEKNSLPTKDLLAERNPYYWKIDQAGNQLPYIDRVRFQVVDDYEGLRQLVFDGKIDMQGTYMHVVLSPEDLDELQKHEEYRLIPALTSSANTVSISLNLTHPDPLKREIFQNKDFRRGLSHGIDRAEIIEQVFAGEGQPYQIAPRPESSFYHEQLAHQYTEHNPELANEYLDKAGYAARDKEGYRIGPDGKRIVIAANVPDYPILIQAFERVQRDWRELGIEATLSVLSIKEFEAVRDGNLHDVLIFDGAGGMAVIQEPYFYLPFGASHYALPWGCWQSNPEDPRAQEPPVTIQKPIGLYKQIMANGDTQKQEQLMRQILDIAADQFYAIGISLPKDRTVIAKHTIRNLPQLQFTAWTYPTPGPINPCQFFIEQN